MRHVLSSMSLLAVLSCGIAAASTPLRSELDADRDGEPDLWWADFDGDGRVDWYAFRTAGNIVVARDLDGNGREDCYITASDGKRVTYYDIDEDGTMDSADTDGDGQADAFNLAPPPRPSTGGTPAGLLGHWDQIDGRSLVDLSPAANHGTLHGDAHMEDRALRLGGPTATDYVQIPQHASYDFSRGFTLSLRVRFQDWYNNGHAADNQMLLVQRSRGNAYTYRLQVTGDYDYAKSPHELTLVMGVEDILRSGVTPSLGQWHHVAATYDLSRAKLFLDGRMILDTPYNKPVPPPAAPLLVGRFDHTGNDYRYYTHGWMRDFRLYGRALSEQEVASLARPGQSAVAVEYRTYESPEWGYAFEYPASWQRGQQRDDGVIFFARDFGQVDVRHVKLPAGVDAARWSTHVAGVYSKGDQDLSLTADLGRQRVGSMDMFVHTYASASKRGEFRGYHFVTPGSVGVRALIHIDDPASRDALTRIVSSLRPMGSGPVAPPAATTGTPGARTAFGTYSRTGSFGGKVFLADIFNKGDYPVYIAIYPVTRVGGSPTSRAVSDHRRSGAPLLTATDEQGSYKLDLPDGSYVAELYDRNGTAWDLLIGKEVFQCDRTHRSQHFKIDNRKK